MQRHTLLILPPCDVVLSREAYSTSLATRVGRYPLWRCARSVRL